MWFTVKAKYPKMHEDGTEKVVTETYLIDAANFSDAEVRVIDELSQMHSRSITITGISKTNIADVYYYDDFEDWYKCKVSYISYDEETGKEKKMTHNFLIAANNTKEAYDRMEESMSDMLGDFSIPSVAVTSIVDIFTYEGSLDVELERRPLESNEEEELENEVEEEEEVEEEDVSFSDELDEE